MPVITIDAISQRNNFITVSDFDTISSNAVGVYTAKPSFNWGLLTDSESDWIKINCLASVRLKAFDIVWTGAADSISLEISNDNFTWIEVWNGTEVPAQELQDFDDAFIFARFKINNLVAGFNVSGIALTVEEEYSNEDFISFMSSSMVPQKMREADPLLEDFIQTYLKMLEDNTKHNLKLIDADYYLHLLTEIDDGLYAIAAKAINVHPIDGTR